MASIFQPTPWVPFGNGGMRRILSDGEKTMLMEAEFAAEGSGIGMHQHPHEQVTSVVKGALRVTVGGEVVVLKPGDHIVIPGNTPHDAVALEAGTIARDVFSPPREDFRGQPPTAPLDWVQMFPGVRRRTRADSDTMTIIEIELSKGGAVPVHQHANEQVTMCISGQITMTLNGETVVLNPNQCLFVPSNAKHSATALTVDSVAYETFSPPRLDFRKK